MYVGNPNRGPLKGMLPTEPPPSSSDCFLIIAMSTGANKEN